MTRSARRNPTRARRRGAWRRLSDEDLLDVRLCDLDVSIEGAEVEARLDRLFEELDDRGLRFRPHVWISSEWFSPDGVPGIAVPFYLLDERLIQLEKKMILEVEGAGERECMKILRHETGHAVCTAYRLHYRKRWRKVFGRFSDPYPTSYKPDPDSRRYVLHFDSWYAQAHPAEDFAETFAVWLRPRSRWQAQYCGWPALRKLEFVDELMAEIADQPPSVRTRRTVEPLSQLTMTLREHYRGKRRRFAREWPEFYDQDLRKIFSDDARYADNETAASFLRKIRPTIREEVSRWTGVYQYTIDQVLRDMIDRCRELRLRLTRSPKETRTQVLLMVTVQTMNYVYAGNQYFAL